MPFNKNFEFRINYLDLIFTGKKSGYTKEDLLYDLNERLEEEGFGSIEIRQLGYDIDEMKQRARKQSVELVYDRLDKRYYYTDPNYSLTCIPLKKEDIDLLTQALAILTHIQGLKQTAELQNIIERLGEKLKVKVEGLGDIIQFDQVPNLKGIEHLNDLLNKVIQKQPLKIQYQPFQKDVEEHIVHPYFLKEYNNRWFLFGLEEDRQEIYNFPLDRIISIDEELIYFNEKEYINPNEYFKDFIGVTKNVGPPLLIKLKFKKPRAYYVETKPLHISQKNVEETKNHIIFEINIIPNREFDALLKSYWDDCEKIA